jgi:hypothetical protein
VGTWDWGRGTGDLAPHDGVSVVTAIVLDTGARIGGLGAHAAPVPFHEIVASGVAIRQVDHRVHGTVTGPVRDGTLGRVHFAASAAEVSTGQHGDAAKGIAHVAAGRDRHGAAETESRRVVANLVDTILGLDFSHHRSNHRLVLTVGVGPAGRAARAHPLRRDVDRFGKIRPYTVQRTYDDHARRRKPDVSRNSALPAC